MAQNIILKRSSLEGKVPTTSSLDLGEIALNTYDGRAFIHKSGSVNTVEQIVVTNSDTTGSINILGTGSFGEISVTNDINVGDSVYVTNDIVGGGDVDVVGAVTASFFVGDGSLLTGIDTSTDTEIPTNDWDYNVPGSGSLSDANTTSTKYTVDFLAEGLGTRPVGYQSFITNTNGSTEIIPGTDKIVFIVNNQEVGIIDSNGIIANIPTGTVSGSSQLTASYDTRYLVTGSVTSSINQLILKTGSYATTGSNTFVDRQYVTGGVEVYSSIAPDFRLVNGTTGIGYHIQNGELGNFQIHNSTTDRILFQFQSASLAQGNQNASFFGGLSVSQSILAASLTGSIAATNGVVSGSSQLPTLATTGSNTFTGLQTFQQIQETVSLKNPLGLGTNIFDFNSGSIFYIAGLTGSGTWNVQNIPSASNAATSLTFVVQQGATAYTASAYQLGGTAVSVKWLDATAPTGSANSTDIIGLTAFRSGSVWNVVGSLSRFA